MSELAYVPTSEPADDLNKSADQLIADMEKIIEETGSDSALHLSRKQMQAQRKFACVLTVTAKAADIQTRRIVTLTWALIWLSAALLALTVFLCMDTHALLQREPTQATLAAPTPTVTPSSSPSPHQ